MRIKYSSDLKVGEIYQDRECRFLRFVEKGVELFEFDEIDFDEYGNENFVGTAYLTLAEVKKLGDLR